jgi:hypothetical protein
MRIVIAGMLIGMLVLIGSLAGVSYATGSYVCVCVGVHPGLQQHEHMHSVAGQEETRQEKSRKRRTYALRAWCSLPAHPACPQLS